MIMIMIPTFNEGDEVLVFDKFNGTVIRQTAEEILIYCPDFNPAEPYLITHISNVILIDGDYDDTVN